MDNDRFEILMGRFIDGEIEPSEQHLLEAQLAADPQSRRLFDQFRQLHTMAQAQITPLANTGRSFDSIFAAAWQRSRRNHHRIAMPWGPCVQIMRAAGERRISARLFYYKIYLTYEKGCCICNSPSQFVR